MHDFWTSEEIFFNGDHYFDRLIEDINSAVNEITVEMYIFNDDALGKKVAERLIAAQKRGVRVQIVVDGVGSYNFFDALHRILTAQGIQVKMYNPLPFYHPYYGGLTFIRKAQVLFIRVLRMNNRNHRKIITIDNRILYTGSFNITAEHTRFHSETAWKDMGVRVTGELVQFAVLNFKKVLKLREYYRYKKKLGTFRPPHWKQAPLRLNQTYLMKQYFYKDLLDRTKSANNRVWLMTPYFIPKSRLIKFLGKAAERGVDVQILISQKSDVPIFRTLQFFYYEYLLKKGVKIFQYTDSVLHAKNYIIDDWMTIGSTNLNHRSFLHDLEVDLIIQDGKNREMVTRHFIDSTKKENSITIEKLSRRPFWDRVLGRLYFVFKYWF
jgi:cardiolipin synthase